jgi:putative multiple sugar transport system substrate-binding protein
MKNLLANVYTSQKLDAVICTDDVLAGGVSRAIVEAVTNGSYAGSMPVITGDGCSEEALDRILQGKQSMSVFYDPTQYAFSVTDLVDSIYHGTEIEVTDAEMYQNGVLVVPAIELIPSYVTAENYEDMIVDTGYLHTQVLLD